MPYAMPWTCRVDLHVHTNRFSPCAESLDPERLPEVMAHIGLQGVVITEHDCLWPVKEIAALNRRVEKGHIYRGVEVSSRNGHFVVIGLETLDGFQPGIDVASLVKIAAKQSAAVIWAHPCANYGNITEPLPVDAMPQGIHAVEVASDVTDQAATSRALGYAKRMGWVPVCGSDAHSLGHVGCVATLFPQLPKDDKALAAAISAGRCRAAYAETDSQGSAK